MANSPAVRPRSSRRAKRRCIREAMPADDSTGPRRLSGRSAMQTPIDVAVILIAVVLVAGCASAPRQTTTEGRTGPSAQEREVADIERAFAKTMADRDFAAFNSFLSNEAV